MCVFGWWASYLFTMNHSFPFIIARMVQKASLFARVVEVVVAVPISLTSSLAFILHQNVLHVTICFVQGVVAVSEPECLKVKYFVS